MPQLTPAAESRPHSRPGPMRRRITHATFSAIAELAGHATYRLDAAARRLSRLALRIEHVEEAAVVRQKRTAGTAAPAFRQV